jgi:hypothetical protein
VPCDARCGLGRVKAKPLLCVRFFISIMRPARLGM